MEALTHTVSFLLSAAVVWFFAGLLIRSVENVARSLHQTDFTVAFFVLGFLTSISEIAVAVNASLEGVPQISVGNLSGASYVLILGVIPLLAVVGGGVNLSNTFSRARLALALIVIGIPAFFAFDGNITQGEGVLTLLACVVMLYAARKEPDIKEVPQELSEELLDKKRATRMDVAKIVGGAIAIFIAGHFLVQESAYLANAIGVPASLIGLLLLSIGTNVPELVIAVRSLLARRKAIAFGNYLGSAVVNSGIFAFVAIAKGTFTVETSGFTLNAILTIIGFTFFYRFARSRHTISKREGIILLCFYGAFVLAQAANVIRISVR